MIVSPCRDGPGMELSADSVVAVDDHLPRDAVIAQRVLLYEYLGSDPSCVGKDDVVVRISTAVRVELGDEYEVLCSVRAVVAAEGDDVTIDAIGRYLADSEMDVLPWTSIDADTAGCVDDVVVVCSFDVLDSTLFEAAPRVAALFDVCADAPWAEQLVEIDLDFGGPDLAQCAQRCCENIAHALPSSGTVRVNYTTS